VKPAKSNYRWYILALGMLTYASVVGLARMGMPVLFNEISADLNLSVAQIGTIWGLDPLAGVFIGLPGGLLADRFGIKRTLVVVCILAGIFCALRGFSVNFLTLAVSMFLFGFMAAVTPSIVPKVTALWFSREQFGIINALLVISLSVGSMIATMTSSTLLSPWLGGWRYVLFLLGGPAIIVGFLWLITGREPKEDETPAAAARAVPLRESLSSILRMKDVWVIGLIQLTNFGANMGLNGYISLYLQKSLSWTNTSADSALTILIAAQLAGVIPMVILADRFRSRKGMLFFSVVITSAALFLLPFTKGTAIYALLFTSAFLRAGIPALFNSLLFEVKGVGSTYAGTAIGLASTIGMLGAFIGPPIGGVLESAGPTVPFIFWGILSAAGIPLFFFLREKAAGPVPGR
jgi:predicted MFS family arabinose efflux permease